MKANYAKSLAKVLVHEGGWVNDPVDPGGCTMKGVTQAVYDSWRRSHGQRSQSVKLLDVDEVAGIYRLLYWDRIRGDDLPSGVDYAVFDFAVNSGTHRAATFLQTVAGVPSDGVIGGQTLEAVRRIGPTQAINALCDKRLGFLGHLKIFWRFGKGWTRRVNEVRAAALAMIATKE